MINIDKRLAKEKFEAKMILQVHDELLFEAPTRERAKVEKLVSGREEGVHKLRCPSVGKSRRPNWRDQIDFRRGGFERKPPGILVMLATVKPLNLELDSPPGLNGRAR